MGVDVTDHGMKLPGGDEIPFGEKKDWPTFIAAFSKKLQEDGFSGFSICPPSFYTDDSNYGDVPESFLRDYLDAAESARGEYLSSTTIDAPATHEGLLNAIKAALSDKFHEDTIHDFDGNNYDMAFSELSSGDFSGVFGSLAAIFDIDEDEVESDFREVIQNLFAENDDSTVFDIFPGNAKLKVFVPIGPLANNGEFAGGDDISDVFENSPLTTKYLTQLSKMGGKKAQEIILRSFDIDTDNVTFNLPVVDTNGDITSDALDLIWKTRFTPDIPVNERAPLSQPAFIDFLDNLPSTSSANLVYAGNLRFLDILLRDFREEGVTVRGGIIAAHDFSSGAGHLETFEGEFTLPMTGVLADSARKYGIETTYGLVGRAWQSEIVSKDIRQILMLAQAKDKAEKGVKLAI